MRAYSYDLRERVVRAVGEGQPMQEAARRFAISFSTVRRYVLQQRETGSLERKPIPGGPRHIGSDREMVLRARLEAAPEATVLEHCAWWREQTGQQVSETTMWRAMHRLGWTHKKRPWSRASGTRKNALLGAKRSPRVTRSSSSSLMKAASIPR